MRVSKLEQGLVQGRERTKLQIQIQKLHDSAPLKDQGKAIVDKVRRDSQEARQGFSSTAGERLLFYRPSRLLIGTNNFSKPKIANKAALIIQYPDLQK
jgi:hypothetical protein